MKQTLAIVAFSVLAVGIVFAQPRSKIAGTWLLSVDVGDTHGTPTVVLRQNGGTLTGTITNPRGQQPLTGTVEGTTAMFSFQTVREGQPTTGIYRGTVESRKRMTGTVEFTGGVTGSGTWVATKK